MSVQAKTLEKLVDSTRDRMIGNHRVATMGIRDVYRSFYLYGTEVCRVWDDKKVFWVDGSYGTKTTAQTINKYREVLTNKGYTEVPR